MNSQHKISIARDFSAVPLGRFPDDSPYNGTTFRENLLVPALEQYKTIEIDLDGGEGYGSSFLEEAFGGLVRIHGYVPTDLMSRISLVSKEDPTLIQEIQQYIQEASLPGADVQTKQS